MRHWFHNLPKKAQQWIWFVLLWCGGLFSVMGVGYIIKFLLFMK